MDNYGSLIANGDPTCMNNSIVIHRVVIDAGNVNKAVGLYQCIGVLVDAKHVSTCISKSFVARVWRFLVLLGALRLTLAGIDTWT